MNCETNLCLPNFSLQALLLWRGCSYSRVSTVWDSVCILGKQKANGDGYRKLKTDETTLWCRQLNRFNHCYEVMLGTAGHHKECGIKLSEQI